MSAINFSLASQSYTEKAAKAIQEIQDQCTRAEKGEKVDLKQTVEKLDGLVKQLNKDRAAINAGAKITREVREAYDLQKSNLTSLNARVKALSAKANIAPAWVKPVAYTALTLGLIAFSAFIVQKTGVLASPSTPMTSNPPAPSSPTVQTPTPSGNTPLPFCDYLDSKGVSNSTQFTTTSNYGDGLDRLKPSNPPAPSATSTPTQTPALSSPTNTSSSTVQTTSTGLGFLGNLGVALGAGAVAGARTLYQQYLSLHSLYVNMDFPVYLKNAKLVWRPDVGTHGDFGPASSATVYEGEYKGNPSDEDGPHKVFFRCTHMPGLEGKLKNCYWKFLSPETQENIQKIVQKRYKEEMWKSMLSFETLAPVGRRAVIVAVATAGLLAVGNLLYRTYYSEDDPTAAAQRGAPTAQS